MSTLLKFLPTNRKQPEVVEMLFPPPTECVDAKAEKTSLEKRRLGVDDASLKATVLDASDQDPDLNPGTLTFEEDTSGGMGRHLGVFSCTLLMRGPSYEILRSLDIILFSIGTIIGTGIFSTPSSILGSVGSVGASLMPWLLGLVISFCGLFVWLELGMMFPRSGGEKVYLEAVYKKPKHLATILLASNAILLGFT